MDANHAIDSAVEPLREFSKYSIRLVKRCHKPDRKEFSKVALRTAIGFVGFFVKLTFIPINNIIVGSVLGRAPSLIYDRCNNLRV